MIGGKTPLQNLTPTRTLESLESGLLCYIPFTDGGGSQANDLTFNKYHASLTSTSWVTGGKISDNTLEFDGVASFAQLPDSSALDMTTGDFSLSYWAKPITIPAGTVAVFNKGSIGTLTAVRYTAGFSGASIAGSICDGSASFISVNSGAVLSAGVWTHGGIVWDRSNSYGAATAKLYIYVNGVQKNSIDISAQPGSISNSNIGTFGKSASSAQQFNNADLQHFRFWNRALTANEVLLDFLRGSHY